MIVPGRELRRTSPGAGFNNAVERLAAMTAAFGFCLVFCLSLVAQEVAVPDKTWTRVDFANKEVSLSLPPGFIVDAEKRDADQYLKIFAFDNGAVIEISIRRPRDPFQILKLVSPGGRVTEFAIDKIKGKWSETKSDHLLQIICLASKKDFYYIKVLSNPTTNPVVDRFLASIRVNDKPLSSTAKPVDEVKASIMAESLTTSPVVKEAFDRRVEKFDPARSGEPDVSAADRYDYRKFSRPPIILLKPAPRWLPSIWSISSTSTYEARLRVDLLANGQIGRVVSETKTKSQFVESCIDAVRKLKFIPAQINGKNVDSSEVVEYTFAVAPVMTPN